MRYLSFVVLCLVLSIVCLLASGCRKDGSIAIGKARSTSSGLQPGINYMQPMKWRMTYRYRIQDITPNRAISGGGPIVAGSEINAAGPGTLEAWFAGPREGEEVRNVKLVKAIPEPTSVKKGIDTDIDLYYYDLSPGNQLPDQVTLTMAWEFITFERYTHWENLPRVKYDKSSELYKHYTKEEDPILFNPDMKRVAKRIYNDADYDPVKTAIGCYNYMLNNFHYNFRQESWILFTGLDAMASSDRAWQNKRGICDEFACVYVAMMRSVGIPARPVAGMCHPLTVIPGESDVKSYMEDYQDMFGPLLRAGGHAWAEFYMPEVGWIPVDPTWGMGNLADMMIPASHSIKGSSREIKVVDYYVGKMDPYRIPMFKDWNYGLNPVPKTPGAEPYQDWMVGYTDRSSDIRKMLHGWPGAFGIGGG